MKGSARFGSVRFCSRVGFAWPVRFGIGPVSAGSAWACRQFGSVSIFARLGPTGSVRFEWPFRFGSARLVRCDVGRP
eukprot:1379316-Pyramimonas_sp.AAC.1